MKLIVKIKEHLKSRDKKSKVDSSDLEKDEYIEMLQNRVLELEELVEEKETAVDRAKSNFLKNIYHEIRTPLNSIVGFSNLIQMLKPGDLKEEKFTNHIKQSSKEFLLKIDDIIDASLVQSGLLKLNISNVNLNNVLSDLYEDQNNQKKNTDKKDVSLILSLPKNVDGFSIKCDKDRLIQILRNLIGNGFKFTQKGFVEYGYRIFRERVLFYVKDTGIGGLDMNDSDVFNLFSKVKETEYSQGGLGLGLALSKKLIDIMNGKIWFDSIEGKGTTFYFTLPNKVSDYKSRKIYMRTLYNNKTVNRYN